MPPPLHQTAVPRPSAPEMYGTYPGTVTSVVRHGCYVRVEGFTPVREGVVHVRDTRRDVGKEEAKDLVRRGERVLVKVIGDVSGKMSLSIKDVDQQTGASTCHGRAGP